MIGGFHRPGTSPLHRAPAGAKLLGLVALGLALGLRPAPGTVLAAALLVAVLTAVAGVGAGAVLGQVRPVAWLLAGVLALQAWLAGPVRAGVVVGALAATVAAAGLVTVTTRVEDLMEALVAALRPLRRAGVDPDRLALLLAMTVRSVPVLARVLDETRQARLARGAGPSLRGQAVPAVVRAVRHADRLGEALVARGLDD